MNAIQTCVPCAMCVLLVVMLGVATYELARGLTCPRYLCHRKTLQEYIHTTPKLTQFTTPTHL